MGLEGSILERRLSLPSSGRSDGSDSRDSRNGSDSRESRNGSDGSDGRCGRNDAHTRRSDTALDGGSTVARRGSPECSAEDITRLAAQLWGEPSTQSWVGGNWTDEIRVKHGEGVAGAVAGGGDGDG